MESSRKKALFSIALVGTVVLVIALLVFQPWRLFTNTIVNESIPTAPPASTTSPEAMPNQTTQSEPVVLFEGELISHEHQTTGIAQIIQLADGTRVLRLENLNTSDGPDLEVWLTDAPVIEGQDGWFVFDDGNHFSLGALKGNQGSQNYEIPADLDLSQFSSMSIWCVTFAVSFGAAEFAASNS